MTRLSPLWVVVWMSALGGCQRQSTDAVASPGPVASWLARQPTIHLVVQGVQNSARTNQVYKPLCDYLTANTPYRFRLLFAFESERVIGLLEARLADMALLDLVSYLEAHEQFDAVALAMPLNQGGEPVSRSAFVVRKDSSLQTLGDLKGHSLALGPFHSASGNLIPRYEIHRRGIGPRDLKEIASFDGDEAVVRAVMGGQFDAGAIAETALSGQLGEGLRALEFSQPFPTSPLVARHDFPREVSEKITAALSSLSGADLHPEWDERIRYGFLPAADSDYQPVRRLLNRTELNCSSGCHTDVRFAVDTEARALVDSGK